MKNLLIGSVIGTVLAFCVPLRALAEEDASIPWIQMYVLSEAGKMVSNQASVDNIIEVAYAAPLCANLASRELEKKLWQAAGLHAYSAIAIADFFDDFESAFDVPHGTFPKDDAQFWWRRAVESTNSFLQQKDEEYKKSYYQDTCFYLITHYTTYGKIPVPDGEYFMPLINPL